MESNKKTKRIMWLLNHTSARKFELEMFTLCGITEIFLPKIIPDDPSFRSASINFDYDQSLSIPKEDLEYLNQINWYQYIPEKAIDLANKYFNVAFFILHDADFVTSFIKKFSGILVWRQYGQPKGISYTQILDLLQPDSGRVIMARKGRSLFCGIAYDHLMEVEDSLLKKRELYLPLGMKNIDVNDQWNGSDASILFVCPDVAINNYYKNIYEQFIKEFKGFPFKILGSQPIAVPDSNVLGYLSNQEYEQIMCDMKLMFYHSQEPYHIHYHPFEAIKRGMPLLFMAGGMLDKFGGKTLPGRCKSYAEARKKAKRILNNDRTFIDAIKHSQINLLQIMDPQFCLPYWEKGLKHIFSTLAELKQEKKAKPALLSSKKQKLAIILPGGYRGGSLRGTKLLLNLLARGIEKKNIDMEIVFCYLNLENYYSEEDFQDIHPLVKYRPIKWRQLDQGEATRAMNYMGQDGWQAYQSYCVPDDGINNLNDCDLWLLISDRVSLPILPLKPYICMVYDYLQRYENIMDVNVSNQFIQIARQAVQVWTTTNFTYNDALQYAGIKPKRAKKLPMLVEDYKSSIQKYIYKNKIARCTTVKHKYFIWTTNLSKHKNHLKTLQGLYIYYTEFDGALKCHITGVNTDKFPNEDFPTISEAQQFYKENNVLKENIAWLGNLTEFQYYQELNGSEFLFHPAIIDNGTFSVIEAGYLNKPSLSNDYPPMREIDNLYKLRLSWCDATSAYDIAKNLKQMENNYLMLQENLRTSPITQPYSEEFLFEAYWTEIEKCL